MSGVDAALDAYAVLYSNIKHKILVSLKSGRAWPGDLKNCLYKEFGVQASMADGIFRQLDGELKSVAELAKLHAQELIQKFKAKKTDIDRKEKSLRKTKANLVKARISMARFEARKNRIEAVLKAAGPKAPVVLPGFKATLDEYHAARKACDRLVEKRDSLKASLHQHKRRLTTLQHRLEEARAQASNPSICFGTKKLFKAQFNLAENGYASHEEWKKDWRAARASSFRFEGNARATSSNEFAKLTPRNDGYFDLELRYPDSLKHLAKQHELNGKVHITTFKKLGFNHGSDAIRAALDNSQPVTVTFKRDSKGWKVHVTVDDALPHAELKNPHFGPVT